MTASLVVLGVFLAFTAVVLGWLFRQTSAPLWTRIAAPTIAVAAGCYAPWSVDALLGYPVPAAERDLPGDAKLAAFVPRDETGEVDLWLILPSGPDPRAYVTKLTPSLKQALRQAQEAMGQGATPRLERGAGVGDDDSHWTLLIESPLPAKE